MTLIRHYRPSTRLDHYDLEGLMNALKDIIYDKRDNGEADIAYYIGAFETIRIIRYHEFVETQDDFLRLFEKCVREMEDER